jgi:hypothetical protein
MKRFTLCSLSKKFPYIDELLKQKAETIIVGLAEWLTRFIKATPVILILT